MNRQELRERIRAGRTFPGGGRALTDAVLERTTGSVCGRARELIVASPEDQPDVTTRRLLSGHLDGCARCRAFADAWQAAQEVLPALSEIDPGPGFAPSVVALTSRRPVSAFAAWWSRIVSRPRFSLEATYVAASLCVILAGNPIALAEAVAERVQLLAPVAAAGSAVPGGPSEGSPGGAAGASGGGIERPALVSWWDQLTSRVAGWWNELTSWMSDLLKSIWNYFEPRPKSPSSGSADDSSHRPSDRAAARPAGDRWNPLG